MRNLHDLIIRDKYDSGGRCDDIKGNLIKDLIIKTNAQLCVEIGVFKGASLMYFAESLEITKGKVIGIDPYTMGSLVNKIPDENLNTYFYDVLFKDQIILDNLYSGLIKIINENELKDIKKGGYIIMDDITWPGVINSITNHLEDKSDLLQKYEDFAVYIKK